MKNIQYWNSFSGSYAGIWEQSEEKRILHAREMTFIRKYIHLHIRERKMRRYLDIGCGTGRILAHIVRTDKKGNPITAIDFSNAMIAICKQKLKTARITYKKMDLHNIARKLGGKYSFATSIRVFKYTPNISAVINSVSQKLDSGSIFVFTVTNKHSIAYFDNLKVAHYKSTADEVRNMLKENNFRVLDIQGFQKLPELLYHLFDRFGLVKIVYKVDHVLGRVLGPVLFSRNLFIAARKI